MDRGRRQRRLRREGGAAGLDRMGQPGLLRPVAKVEDARAAAGVGDEHEVRIGQGMERPAGRVHLAERGSFQLNAVSAVDLQRRALHVRNAPGTL